MAEVGLPQENDVSDLDNFIPDMSGVWEPDMARSESLDPMFALMVSISPL